MNVKWKKVAAVATLLLFLVAAISVGVACREGRCEKSEQTNLRGGGDAPLQTVNPKHSSTTQPTTPVGDPTEAPTDQQETTFSPTTAPSSTQQTSLPSTKYQTPAPSSGPTGTGSATTNAPTTVDTPSPTVYSPPPPPLTGNLVNVTRFQPTDDDFARFGGSVALDGEFMVVGADGDQYTGRAFVYEKDETGKWRFLQVLQADNGRNGDGFGYSVAIHGGRLVVGAPYCDPKNYEQYLADSAGCAYIYVYQDGFWQLDTKLESSMIGGAQKEQMGYSVAIRGDTVIVSAPKWSSDEGRVYVFRRTRGGAWQLQQALRGSFAYSGSNSLFGWQVAMDTNRIIVGCVRENDGSAYIFARESWNGPYQLEQKLVPNEPVAGWFGQGVAIDKTTIVVGRPHREGFDIQTGKSYGGGAYVFTKSDASSPWTETQILRQVDGSNDYFGTGVAVHGNNIVVGAPNGQPDDHCFIAREWNNSTFCIGSLGIAYTYTRPDESSNWTMVQELYEEVSFDAGKDFGMALDLQDSVVAIGVRKAGTASGRVVVFDRPEA